MLNIAEKTISWGLNLGYPLFKRLFSFQVYAYLAVGAFNTLLNILWFALFNTLLQPYGPLQFYALSLESYTLSLLLAFALSVPTGFWLNSRFAFAKGNGAKLQKKQLLKYVLVVGQGLLSDYLLLKMLIVWAGFPAVPAKIASTIVILVLNYLLQKHFTFKLSNKS